jgi:hypothetical protein
MGTLGEMSEANDAPSVASTGVKIDKPRNFDCTNIDPKEKPFAHFCFRYRSISTSSFSLHHPFACIVELTTAVDDLKAELIIPRSPSPIPLEDRPLESLSLEESLELLRRQRVSVQSSSVTR